MNTQLKVASLQDAKALNVIDAPLNTPIAHHHFSLKYNKLCDALVLAQLRFLRTVFRYVPEGQNASVRKRQLVGRRLDDIVKVVSHCDAFVSRPGGASRSNQDEHEQSILALFLSQRAIPFVEFWQKTVEEIANGAAPEIKWRDIPVWFSEFMSKPG